jgi:hypothetical protein
MVDMEVEETLREIRERVRAEAAALQTSAPAGTEWGTAEGAGNGQETFAAESLSRMEANLATTARAYSKLPPVQSYRSGFAARLEIFLKKVVRRATRWFTWEQVNFNSGAHHAMLDAHAALAAHERTLVALKSDIFAVRDELRGALAQVRADSAWLAAHRAETEALRVMIEEVSERLTEEQRVCFRQLSLEVGETATGFDRARRLLEARLDELEALAAATGERTAKTGAES